LTHVKRKGSALTEIGKVIWHSLNASGETKLYDILWETGKLERNISIDELEDVGKKQHEHTVAEEATPIKERKMKLDRNNLREIILSEIKAIISETEVENDIDWPLWADRDEEKEGVPRDEELDAYVFGLEPGDIVNIGDGVS